MRRAKRVGVCAGLVGALLAGIGDSAGAGGGSQRWTASYHSGAPAYSDAVAVAPDGDTVFVTGTTHEGPWGHFATLAYDASTGAEKWLANFSGSSEPNQGDRGNALAVSPDGSRLYVTGESSCSRCAGAGFSGYSTVAYDASTGDRLWAARYTSAGGPYSIAVSRDGSTVYVNGQASGGEASTTLAYDASDGQRLWAAHEDDAPVYWAGGLSVSPNGSTVYVVGTAQSTAGCYSPSGGYHTTAYDSVDGSVKWSSTYQVAAGQYCGTATSLGMTGDGSTIVVTGYGSGDGGSNTNQSGTVAYDTRSGAQIWAKNDDSIRVLPGDTVVPLAVSRDGSKAFVLGYDCAHYPCPDQPFATVAYDVATGDRLWVSHYDGGGRGYPMGLAVSRDGSTVFETGQVTLPCFDPCTTSELDAPLVAYDAETGNEQWATTYPDNLGWAVEPSPDGSSVYLAGTFTASASTSHARSDKCSPTACGYSIAGYNADLGPGRLQDSDTSVRLDRWKGFFAKNAVGGAYRASRTRGDTATFTTPKTTSVVWLSREGPYQGKAKVSVDGHSKGVFDLYDSKASARAVTFKGLARRPHTVRVTVLGKRAAASKGTWIAVDGFEFHAGSGIAEESDAQVRYDAWTGVSRPATSGGSYRESGSHRAHLSLVFKARAITWITATGPAYGRARVVIDGKGQTVDLYRRSNHWQARITFKGLGKGKHHIKVRALDKKDAASRSTNVVVDAFVVR